jgi:undecaprenyl diphosphate synthase
VRPIDEVRYLMNFNRACSNAASTNCTPRACASSSPVAATGACPRVLKNMEEASELTKKNKVMTLNIAFNYGGRAEIVDAVRQLVSDKVPAGKIDEKAIRSRLYHPELSDPDLIVRTSGEYRISNFLLWEMAYSELVFTDVLWPDFRREDLFEAIEEYQQRERRFGGLDK